MSRRLLGFGVIAVLLAAQFGCNTSRCNSGPGWFSSNKRTDTPCQLTGRNTGCFDAVTGQPVPCPPDMPGMLPGGPFPPPPPMGVGPNPNELHMPSPTDRIPAIPIPAPGDASLPFPTLPGTPVKSGQNK